MAADAFEETKGAVAQTSPELNKHSADLASVIENYSGALTRSFNTTIGAEYSSHRSTIGITVNQRT